MILGLSIYFILLDFYIFAFVGWIYESTFVSIRDKKLVNRGFLVGPILPLYGFGAVLVYVLLRPFSHIASLLYVMGMIVATIIEYFTSVLLETLFHTKWWDYSKEPYNFQGRIALIPSMFWGILSLLMFDIFQPVATYIIHLIPQKLGNMLLIVLIVITCIDLVYTVITAINFSKQMESLYEFKKELEYLLEDIQFSSLRDIVLAPVKEKTNRSVLNTFNEKKELFYNKLNSLRNESGTRDIKITVIEERFKSYWENRSRFLKKNPLLGNQRLIDAFPTMKFLPKNHSAVDVKEVLMNIKQKTQPFKERIQGKKGKEKEDIEGNSKKTDEI